MGIRAFLRRWFSDVREEQGNMGQAPVETRSYRDREGLTPFEAGVFHKGQCPDCGGKLRQGPSGGLSINYGCVGGGCGSRFNEMGPFGIERISDPSPLRRTS